MLLCPWASPGKNTGVGCHFLRQGIFPTQGSNLGLPHCRQTLYHLSLQGSYRGGWPTNWTSVILKKFSPSWEGSEPHITLPRPGTQQRDGNPQGIWPWRPAELDYKTSTGLGETKISVLKDTNKALHTPRLRGKEQWCHRKLTQNHLLELQGLLWRCRSARAHCRDQGTGSSCLGRSPLA